jgi:hypothetical protein
MKTLTIVLLAMFANLLLLFGVLVLSHASQLDHLSDVNWLTFVPVAILYSLGIALIGLLMGGIVNGLLVYPKRPGRNLRMSEFNTGLLGLVVVVYFAWATGSFSSGHTHPSIHSWAHTDLIYKDISEKGFKAF